jgi:hypothetical protein
VALDETHLWMNLINWQCTMFRERELWYRSERYAIPPEVEVGYTPTRRLCETWAPMHVGRLVRKYFSKVET